MIINSNNCAGGDSYISPSCDIIAIRLEQLICESGNAPDSSVEDMSEPVIYPW